MMRLLFSCLLFSGWTLLSAQALPAQKCSPALQQRASASRPTDDRAGKAQKMFFTVVTTDLNGFRVWMQHSGLTERAAYAPAGVVVFEDLPRHFFDTTLLRPEVVFADLGALTAREELPVPGHNLFVNNIPFVHARWLLLDGRGATISIKEFGFDSTDVDFKNRYLPNPASAPTLTTHANIMASLAAGAGTSNPAGRGVARGSWLVSSSFVGLLPDPDADYDALHITVQNHAYGVDIENYYGAGALAYDENVQQHAGLLHVFSAGNQGTGVSTSGTYAGLAGFANLTGNFKMAKNVLVVGAVDSFLQVAPYSSRGPAYDGRTKPDLVAFGHDGTSEATALVSGSAAVIRQAFFERYGYAPSSALLRAILVGTADDLGLPGPDFNSGYGNLNLKKAVALVQGQFLAEGALGQGEERSFTLALPAQAGPLKITLAWNDLPAAPLALRALVNDLDLVVQTPDSSFRYPWVLHTFPDPDSLALPAGRGRDSINTLEQLSIAHPLPGVYRILVKGKNVSGMQTFALAFQWDTLQQFRWTCPVKRDPVAPGKEAVLRWESHFTGEKGILAWKAAGSGQWQTIDSAVLLTTGYRRWIVPDTVTPAQLRLQIAGLDFVSDTFLIAPELRLRIGFNCTDSIQLQWTALAPALKYRLWGLGDRYLEPVLTTTDTSVVLPSSLFPQRRFAVSALSPEGMGEGPISGAPDIFAQGVGCYLNGLLGFLNGHQVDLHLQLGSRYGVRQVYIEKWRAGSWVLLSAADPTALDLFFTDFSLQTGPNTYRGVVTLEHGGLITGEPVVVYFAGENGYFALPNPVSPAGLLTVLAGIADETQQFVLFDALGQFILQRSLDDVRVDIQLPALPPGYYFWRVVGGVSGSRVHGKLLVRD